MRLNMCDMIVGNFENTMFQRRHILLGICIITMIGVVMCLDGFTPLYTQKIYRTEMHEETENHVYLEPPSTEASCGVLCGLTPGCMWFRFNTDTGICSLFQAVCLQPLQNQDVYLTAIFSNMVNTFSNFRTQISYSPQFKVAALNVSTT